MRADRRVDGSCGSTDLVVLDDAGNEVFIAKAASPFDEKAQFCGDDLFFWICSGISDECPDSARCGLTVTNLVTRKSRILANPPFILEYAIAPNCAQLAFYTNKGRLEVVDFSSPEARKSSSFTDDDLKRAVGWQDEPSRHFLDLRMLGWSRDNRDFWFRLRSRASHDSAYFRLRGEQLDRFDDVDEFNLPSSDNEGNGTALEGTAVTSVPLALAAAAAALLILAGTLIWRRRRRSKGRGKR